jgi:hypothetical protein
MHFNLLDVTSLQIFPTFPQPIVVAAAVFFALWVLVRWGAPLLFLYALTRVCVGEWGQAMIAVVFAVLIEFGNGFASWLEWNAHGRDAALHRHDRDHARH